jgi:hypothetical protein
VLQNVPPIGWSLRTVTRVARARFALTMQPLPLLDFRFLSHQSIPGERWGKDKNMSQKSRADMLKTLRHIQDHLAQNLPRNDYGPPEWWRGSQRVFIARHRKAQGMVYEMITEALKGK